MRLYTAEEIINKVLFRKRSEERHIEFIVEQSMSGFWAIDNHLFIKCSLPNRTSLMKDGVFDEDAFRKYRINNMGFHRDEEGNIYLVSSSNSSESYYDVTEETYNELFDYLQRISVYKSGKKYWKNNSSIEGE